MKTQRRAFCAFCRGERVFGKPSIDHGFHRAICILTGGLWAIIWLGLLVVQIARIPWRCGFCGHRLRRGHEACAASARRSGVVIAQVR